MGDRADPRMHIFQPVGLIPDCSAPIFSGGAKTLIPCVLFRGWGVFRDHLGKRQSMLNLSEI